MERQEPQLGPHAAYGSSLGAMLQFGQDDAGEHEHEPPAPLQHAQPMCAHICEHDRVQSHGSGGFGVVVFGGSGGAGPLATIAKTGMVAMPQIPVGPTPRFISMNPCSPHEGPHEFLTIQVVAVYPTTSTPWSSLVPHVAEKTPDLYCWNAGWSASMATATGPSDTAASS